MWCEQSRLELVLCKCGNTFECRCSSNETGNHNLTLLYSTGLAFESDVCVGVGVGMVEVGEGLVGEEIGMGG